MMKRIGKRNFFGKLTAKLQRTIVSLFSREIPFFGSCVCRPFAPQWDSIQCKLLEAQVRPFRRERNRIIANLEKLRDQIKEQMPRKTAMETLILNTWK